MSRRSLSQVSRPCFELNFARNTDTRLTASRSEQDEDDDEASAYAPSEHGSAPSTPLAQQQNYYDPSHFQFQFNAEDTPRGGHFHAGPETAADEEEDGYQSSKRSSAGPVRKKGTSKARKKGASGSPVPRMFRYILTLVCRSREATSKCVHPVPQLRLRKQVCPLSVVGVIFAHAHVFSCSKLDPGRAAHQRVSLHWPFSEVFMRLTSSSQSPPNLSHCRSVASVALNSLTSALTMIPSHHVEGLACRPEVSLVSCVLSSTLSETPPDSDI